MSSLVRTGWGAVPWALGLTRVVAALVSLALPCGCSAGTTPASAGSPRSASEPAPVPPPPLRVGTSGDYSPFSEKTAEGLSGFDVDVAQALARDWGRAISWVSFRWPDLSDAVRRAEFDVAMSGVTWRPSRDVEGYMTRAVAWGGPCLLGDLESERVLVNRGGWLEAWAREHLSGREIAPVDDNRSLPHRLESGEGGVLVTDSFELPAFRRAGWDVRCEPPRSRKVYWVTGPRAAELGGQLDAWLSAHGELLRELQRRHFGEAQALDDVSHLVDLVARRLAYMPLVARYKRRHGLPIEDREREARVLASALEGARREGLEPERVRVLFELQIELAKAVQRRAPAGAPSLELAAQIRPALVALGGRIVQALRAARDSGALAELGEARLSPLEPWLSGEERSRLARALRGLAAPN